MVIINIGSLLEFHLIWILFFKKLLIEKLLCILLLNLNVFVRVNLNSWNLYSHSLSKKLLFQNLLIVTVVYVSHFLSWTSFLYVALLVPIKQYFSVLCFTFTKCFSLFLFKECLIMVCYWQVLDIIMSLEWWQNYFFLSYFS